MSLGVYIACCGSIITSSENDRLQVVSHYAIEELLFFNLGCLLLFSLAPLQLFLRFLLSLKLFLKLLKSMSIALRHVPPSLNIYVCCRLSNVSHHDIDDLI